MAASRRHSANYLATLSLDATWDGSDSGCLDSPATPAAPAGSDARSPLGAQAAYAGKDTGNGGFRPSVALADRGVLVRSPLPRCPR